MIATCLFSQPWAISRPHFDALLARYAEWLEANISEPGQRAGITLGAPTTPAPTYQVANGIATVPIHGVLMQNPDDTERWFLGAVSMLELQDTVSKAAADPAASAILLDIDSPGGTVVGTPELANTVRAAAAAKPVVSFTHNLMASAAYWVGSQADAVLSTPSARVGSVGVIMQVPNYIERLRKAGVKVETFAAGKFKGAGNPYMDMTAEHRNAFQGGVEAVHGEFKQAVLSRRTTIQASDMEGQVFAGREAAGKGFTTGLVQSIHGARARAAALAF